MNESPWATASSTLAGTGTDSELVSKCISIFLDRDKWSKEKDSEGLLQSEEQGRLLKSDPEVKNCMERSQQNSTIVALRPLLEEFKGLKKAVRLENREAGAGKTRGGLRWSLCPTLGKVGKSKPAQRTGSPLRQSSDPSE